MSFEFRNLGKIRYEKAWEYQTLVFNDLLDHKNRNAIRENELIFCEHPHVLTIGKSGNLSNLLIDKTQLEKQGVEYFHIDRGGDITYHGPGQLVAYPLFDLDSFGIGTREYVFKLEDIIIRTMNEFNISCGRLEGAAGIWLEADKSASCRKICAIGVRSSKRVTMHGLALNINTDLSYFELINPCGFTDRGVTSMQKELGKTINYQEVALILLKKFQEEFELV